jgi:predicted regulator of Ras-like GTPase activity (Roadblock/LC7/MglB family)
MHATPFTPILRTMLVDVPDSLGAIFADWEGEAVDQFPDPRRAEDAETPLPESGIDTFDLRLFGAHWGVILNHVNLALRTFHYGDPQIVMLHHERLDILIQKVDARYYLLLALRPGAPLGRALRELERGVQALRVEM